MVKFHILRANLSTGEFREEVIGEDLVKKYLGGRGLGTYLALKEIPRGVDPFSPSNKLYLFSGPLSGIVTLASSRLTVVGKSPLTGSLTHSNMGGNFNVMLRKSGFDGIVVEGASDEPVYILVKDGEPQIRPAKHIWGKWTDHSTKLLLQDAGFEPDERKAGVVTIGPAGENLVRIAGIRGSDYERFAGRGGLGAVMGSKKLKGIVVWGTRDLNKELVDRQKFAEVHSRYVKMLSEADVSKALHKYGTNVLMNIVNSIGALPTRNFETGVFEEAEKVSEEYMQKAGYFKEVHGCMMCPIACTQMHKVESGPFKFMGKVKHEYESTWALAPNLGIGDPGAMNKLTKLANELGMDTISLGNVLATAVELAKKGKLPIPTDWNDPATMIDLAIKTAYRDGVGDELAEGDYRLALKYGEPEAFVGARGQGFPAYDPRALKGFALAYMTANRGGDHLEAYTPTWEILGAPKKVDPLDDSPTGIEEQARLVKWNQDLFAVVDSTIICKFDQLDAKGGIFENALADLYNAAFGWDWTPQDVLTVGERIFNAERLFHVKEGKWVKDELTPRLRKPLPSGPAAGHSAAKMFDEGIKVYYRLRGWEDGKPLPDTLKRLGLEEFLYLL